MTIKIQNYGQERERIATESELEIFELMQRLTGRDDLDLVRKSDNYVSIVLGEWDLARIKFTPRAKWLSFPITRTGTEKIRITAPEDVSNFADQIADSLKIIEKYS